MTKAQQYAIALSTGLLIFGLTKPVVAGPPEYLNIDRQGSNSVWIGNIYRYEGSMATTTNTVCVGLMRTENEVPAASNSLVMSSTTMQLNGSLLNLASATSGVYILKVQDIAKSPNSSACTGIYTSTTTYSHTYFIWDDATDQVLEWGPWDSTVATETRIISVTPTNNSTVGTTTSIGATIYVDPNDWREGMFLHMSFTNQTLTFVGGTALDAWNAAFNTEGIDIPITSAGTSQLSTTTTFTHGGVTEGDYSIRTDTFLSSLPLLGIYFSDDELVATSTKFTVGQATPLDLAVASSGQALADYLLTGTTSMPVLDCDGVGFDLQACLVSVLVPPAQVLRQDLDIFTQTVLRAWPIGYITRAVEIITTEATSTLPTISYTFGSSTALSGETLRLDPWTGAASVIASLKSTGDNPKTAWDILGVVWRTLVYLMLAIMILHDITGIHKHKRHA